MVEYRLERLNDENAHEWEDLNSISPDGSIFHSLRWTQATEKCSGRTCHHFLLFKNDDIFGIFPFSEHSIYSFRGLVPVNNPMNIPAILQDYSDPFAMEYAIKALRSSNKDRRKISFIGLSTLHERSLDTITQYPLFPYADDGDMVLDLSKYPPEKLWNTFSKKKRQKIRRYDKDGFEIETISSLDDLNLFYKHYEENMKHIGGSLKPFSHFVDLWNSFSDEIRITLLSDGARVAGGVLMLADKPRKMVHLVYLSLNRNLQKTYTPSFYIYWEAINWAWENNYEKVSFGIEYSNDLHDNNPRYLLKRSCGAQFTPIHSRIIPLSRFFSLGVRYKKRVARRQPVRSKDQSQSTQPCQSTL